MDIFWFRRDLRLTDNHGLYESLKGGTGTLPLFIFDRNILDELESDDARVTFIHDQLQLLKEELQKLGSDLIVKYGHPIEIWKEIIAEYKPERVYFNHDYEPYATDRDESITNFLNDSGISVASFKDHVIYEKKEILTSTDSVYTVFTPYKKRWLSKFEEDFLPIVSGGSVYPSEDFQDNFYQIDPDQMIPLSKMGFERNNLIFPSKSVSQKVIKNYKETRNFPGLEKGTSHLGIHFRFGTISIREKARRAYALSETYLSELIWRDFYAQILANFPHVVHDAFRSKYDRIPWRFNEEEFEKWCNGNTGYPIVDAGMRQLNQTGYMHNRVRMITASFLTKHLLHDWRRGEAYFAKKLLDFDLASNNGGWQWASGSGTDAAPYFRIFNPTSQMEKFDKDKKYVKKWVPEYGTEKYPKPIVDHKFARERCLNVYKEALSNE